MELHERTVDGGAAVHAKFAELEFRIGLHSSEQIGALVGDAFQRGTRDVGGGGAAGEADDGAAGGGVPVRRAEAGEGGDEVNAAVVGRAGGVFERGGRAEPPRNGGEQLVFGDDGFSAGVQQEKATGTVGVLGEAGAKTRLAEESGLLIAGDARNGDTVEGGDRLDLAVNFAAGVDGRENFPGDAEKFEESGVPFAGAEVEQESARGVGDIGGVNFAAGELPEEPSVDGTEREFAAGGAAAGAGDVVEQPGKFRTRKIGIEQQAGFLAEERFESAFL